MSILEELKNEYNHNLRRYYNGIRYCEEHIEEVDMWIPELDKIMYKIGRLLDEIRKIEEVSSEEEFGGFKY